MCVCVCVIQRETTSCSTFHFAICRCVCVGTGGYVCTEFAGVPFVLASLQGLHSQLFPNHARAPHQVSLLSFLFFSFCFVSFLFSSLKSHYVLSIILCGDVCFLFAAPIVCSRLASLLHLDTPPLLDIPNVCLLLLIHPLSIAECPFFNSRDSCLKLKRFSEHAAGTRRAPA